MRTCATATIRTQDAALFGQFIGCVNDLLLYAMTDRGGLRDLGGTIGRCAPEVDCGAYSGVTPTQATASLLRTENRLPNLASQIRTAFSSIDWKTGSRSPGELLMTLRTSAVAVCCSSDCLSSLSSRVFSMAMTAWAAKFFTSSICLSVNGRTSWRLMVITPIARHPSASAHQVQFGIYRVQQRRR